MAASSILHNFVISDKKSAEKFIDALDAASAEPDWKASAPVKKPLRDPEAIRTVLEKWKATHE
jgi:uncharacterized protein (DUF2147 family)